MKNLDSIFTKLDLVEFVEKFTSYLSRYNKIELDDDISHNKLLLQELNNLQFNAPNKIKLLDEHLIRLQKQAILGLEDIFEFIKIIRYFIYLKKINTSKCNYLSSWFNTIIIPQDMLNLESIFLDTCNIKQGVYDKLDKINELIIFNKKEITNKLSRILQNHNLSIYLVSNKSYILDSKECLLLSAGYSNVLDGRILARSKAGYFYVIPNVLQNNYEKLAKLEDEYNLLIYEIEKEISLIFSKNILFLKFINKQFDKFDALQARIFFAREQNLNFLFPAEDNNNQILLIDFIHPILKNPIPINISFKEKILIITGVNAGGKTMLLKSILSASLLAKLLIPFKINSYKSMICNFEYIFAIINDPQDSSNNISTFAGRMIEFSSLLNKDNFILGVDEIELGTDSNEASAIYFSLMNYFKNKNIKIILTTHHKQLAFLLSKDSNVELLAALYDEKLQIPTYTFIEGLIGKSYAYEVALRYGIPKDIIDNAKKVYGDNLDNLNDLITRTSLLHLELKEKEKELDLLINDNENKKLDLDSKLESNNKEFKNKIYVMENIYQKLIDELKDALKIKDRKYTHRMLNKHKIELLEVPKPKEIINDVFNVNDRVMSGHNKGIISKLNGNIATIVLDNGVKLKTKISYIKKIKDENMKNNSNLFSNKVEVDSNNTYSVFLNLYGKKVDEALEILDKYISDCLIAGFDEVIINHGIGNGVLSLVVREFLSNHPNVKSFSDVPARSGGNSAKIVKL